MTLNQHLADYPRGREYTYAARIRGLPYLFTDNRTSWNLFAQTRFSTLALPYLVKTDWNLKFESNPLEPLAVGSGTSFGVVRDPGGLVHDLFSPTREQDFELVIDETSLTTTRSTFSIKNSPGLGVPAQGTLLYWGLETMNVVSTDVANEVTVERAFLGSTARRYQEVNTSATEAFTEGTLGLLPMDPLTSHPTIWRGRYVDIYMGVIQDNGALGDVWPIWAGRLDSFAYDGPVISISCDPLTASLTKDSWPQPLPKGSFKSDTIKLRVNQEDMFVTFSASNTGLTTADDGIRLELGTYDTAVPAVFTPVTVASGGEWMTLERVARLIQDTVIYGIINNAGTSGTNANNLMNNLSVAVARTGDDDSTWYVLLARNETPIHIVLQDSSGILSRLMHFTLDAMWLNAGGMWRWTIGAGDTEAFGAFGKGSGFTLGVAQGTLACVMDNRGQPFDENRGGCYDPATEQMLGYLRITQEDEVEVISFSSSGIGNDGNFYADIQERGLGGTLPRYWGGGADPISLEQITCIRVGNSMSMADLILYLLMSTATDVTPGPNGNYDYLGEWVGLGIPSDLVDIEGIIARLAITDMPRPAMFWVPEAGKGKDAVEELLRANGIYLVTRRFTRDGVERFGVSVDVVDVPASSSFNTEFTDSDLSANKSPRVDINERLLINVISLSPHYKFGSDTSDTGGKRFTYAEESIAKFGAAKTLEMEPSTIFNVFNTAFGGNYTDPEEITVAIVTAIGLRWFGAFSYGNYTLSGETPHIGWKFQAGDRVLITLTGVPNPDGSDGFANVIAKVVDVTHRHGSGAGARVSLRLSVVQSAELAPCLNVVSVDGAEITLASEGYGIDEFGLANPWSWFFQRGGEFGPFYQATPRPQGPFGEAPGADVQWFDPTRHTDNNRLRIRLWPRGNYADWEEFEVLSAVGNVLTLDSAPTTGLLEESLEPVSGLPVALIGTFALYDNPSTLRAAYAHLGSNAHVSLLGGTQRAKRWV